jgi:hypothetical protein
MANMPADRDAVVNALLGDDLSPRLADMLQRGDFGATQWQNKLAGNVTPIHGWPRDKDGHLVYPDWVYQQPSWQEGYAMDPMQFHDEFFSTYPKASRELMEHEMRKYYDAMQRQKK